MPWLRNRSKEMQEEGVQGGSGAAMVCRVSQWQASAARLLHSKLAECAHSQRVQRAHYRLYYAPAAHYCFWEGVSATDAIGEEGRWNGTTV